MPIGYWPLAEVSGDRAVDYSGNGNHGTYQGAPALASRVIGRWVCPDLDGSNDYVSVPSLSPAPSTGITLEAWVIRDAVCVGAGVISERYSGGGDRIMYEVGLDPLNGTGSNIAALMYPGSGGTVADSAVTPTNGVPYHLVATCDGNRNTIYIDGTERQYNSSTLLSNTLDNDEWFLGRRHDTASSGPYWNGPLAQAAIYGYALPAARVLAHYLAGVRQQVA